MATLTVVSDLHLEARSLSADEVLDPTLKSDVLCLLGDIGDPSSAAYRDFLAACAARFPTVLLLAGNNEYRNHDGGGRTMAQTEELIRLATAAHPNVHFLQNSAHVVGDVAFIGATLWSYLPDTPLPPPLSDEAAEPASSGPATAAATDGHRPAAAMPPVPQATLVHVAAGGPSLQEVNGASGTSAADRLALDALIQLGVVEPVATAELPGADSAPAATAPQRQLQSQPSLVTTASSVPPPQAVFQQWGIMRAASGFSLPIPAPSRPTGSFSAACASGGATTDAAGATVAGRLPMAQPRFMSYSMPPSDWMTSPGSNSRGSSTTVGVACGTGCAGACGASGAAGRRACRRRKLRHCVSLSSLRPDEACPSWRAVQAGCASGGGRSGGTSSESDARGSDSDSAQSSSDGSETERSDASPYVSGDSVVPGGARMLDLPKIARAAGGSGRAGGSGIVTAAAVGKGVGQCLYRTGASLDGTSVGIAAAANAGGSKPTSDEVQPLQLPAPSSPPQTSSQPTAAGAIGALASSAIPAFFSEPGSLLSAAGGGDVRKPPASVAVAAEAAAAAAAPESSADGPAAGGGGAAAAPAPKARHHHHHHHHHHHRSHSHGPPPSTIREFIGATSLDFRRIFAVPGGQPITPDDTNALFRASLAYIRSAVAVARERGLVPVVLSHHAPSMSGTSRPAFAGHPSTHSYSSDLEAYLEGSGIAAWYCGHTHYNFDRVLQGGARLASNQFGSQPKPADGYSRTWQHRLPSANSSGSGGKSTRAPAGAAGPEHPPLRGMSASLASAIGLGAAAPVVASAWAY